MQYLGTIHLRHTSHRVRQFPREIERGYGVLVRLQPREKSLYDVVLDADHPELSVKEIAAWVAGYCFGQEISITYMELKEINVVT